MNEPVPTSFETASDGALIVPSRQGLPQAIRTAPENATIEVPNDTLMELGNCCWSRQIKQNRFDI